MKVLMSGGAGFIGSWLTESLVLKGNHVTILDNMSTGKYENVKHLENVKVLHVDLGTGGWMRSTDKWDCIIHLASPASPDDFVKKPIDILNVNTTGTQQLLETARLHDARFIFASTSEIYGDPHPDALPLKETYWGNVNPVGIRGCYDVGKRAGEAYCMAYLRQHGVDARIARIFNTYGERMPDDGRVVVNFIRQATSGEPITIYGDGSQTRSFTYVSDTVNALIKMINSRYAIAGVPINIGSRNEISIMELGETVAKLCDVPFNMVNKKLPIDDPKRRIPNTVRARSLLNWKPTVQLEEGLEKTIRWWKNDR